MVLAGSQSGVGRGPPLRFFLYNPCSLIASGCPEDVATTPRADIILCPGTSIRATIGDTCRVQSMGSLGADDTLRVVTRC